MFDGFEPFTITTQTEPRVDIFGLKSGDGSSGKPPLLLLHGFPQTHHIWHRVAPQLTATYTVVLLDLRGYGQSSKPAGVESYAKSAMARDCAEVMTQLGFTSPDDEKKKFFVCAHDRGARVAHKLCVDHPARVRAALFLDICPTLAMYAATSFDFARAYFHWFLLIQPAPLPETMLLADPRRIAEAFLGGRQEAGTSIFAPACWERYVAGLGDEPTVHAMCNDYRAAATVDLDEAREDIGRGRGITCPLKVLWGQHGVIEKCFDAVKEWQSVSSKDVAVEGHSVDSGHYIPEQIPDVLVSEIKAFFTA
ncbi:alpha beta hydrolase fold protein [Apiospora marii]|uniref:Alpha beta hydrolase fold protein n=1 Tax=Apiospora marii TaxID=335849 RepID=A0ABR1RYM7_9PEZI